MQRKMVVVRRDSTSRQWPDEGEVMQALRTFARAADLDLYFINLGHLDFCSQAQVLHDTMLLLAVHGADLANMVFLPAGAAVVELGVECEVEGGSVDTPYWRGPGTLINSSIYQEAVDRWRQQSREGKCPPAGAIFDSWLQGAPISQFAKLARQANLMYTAVMDCSAANCTGRPMGDVWDRGWCNGDVKSRQHIQLDLHGQLIPVIWIVYD